MQAIDCKICGSRSVIFLKDVFDDRHGYPGRFDIYRCGECGFCQTLPEIPADRIGEIYSKYYPRKALIDVETVKNRPVRLPSGKERWLKGTNNSAHYHIKAGSRVLDIGCGDCSSILEINAMGAEGYGIEPDTNIKPLVDALGLNVHVGLFDDIPFPERFFDYITLSQVLEHIHDPVALLSALRRVLKKDGEVIIGVPNVDSRLRKKYAGRWLNWHVPYHINHFSRKSLEVLARRSGYRVKRTQTITPYFWLVLQYKMLKFPVGEGVRVPFFNGEPETPACEDGGGLIRRLSEKLTARFNSVQKYKYMMELLSLRAADMAGLGESYLVFLEARD